MHFSTLLSAGLLAGLADLARAGYTVQDTYSPSDFFSMFSFFTGADPTSGFVNYVDQSTAQADGLLSTSANSVRWGVDSTSQTSTGRTSVRLTSNKSYNQGLFILDLAHMPTGCGTWPAFWLVGPNWPNDGEIDIIEGVNGQQTNEMTLHTGPGCSIGSSGFSGNILNTGCDVTNGDNTGCGIGATSTNTYGSGLNAIQGGVYATEWAADSISIWYFPRGSIPSDISSGSPNPSGWGTPLSYFAGACQFSGSSTNFQDMNIVFDTTFCGQWAGQASIFDATCPGLGTCNSYVGSNPSAFTNAYWEVNSLTVYSSNGDSSSGGSAPSSKPATPASSPISAAASSSSSIVWLSSQNFEPAPTTTSSSIVWLSSQNFEPAPTTSSSSIVWLSSQNFEPAPTPSPSPSPNNTPVAAQGVSSTTEERGSTTPLANGEPIPASFFGNGNSSGSKIRRHERHVGVHRRHAREMVGLLS